MISLVDQPSPRRVVAGRYELGEIVGAGGMGEVRQARDLQLDRPVAIKFLRAHVDPELDIRARFEAEGEAAGRLSHPNIVAVFDSGEDEGVPFIVMELLPGTTLAQRLASGPLDESEVRRIALEILAALETSHGEGILHRDLKPGNVMLTREGSAKVADFGIAKITEGMDITDTGMLLGTPAYLAPERVAGDPATEQTDIYSLGVVMYELLTGKKPFDADTPLGLVRAIQEDDPEPLNEVRPDVDPELVAIVEKAMAKDPGDRFSSAPEMARVLREWIPRAATEQTDSLPAVGSTQGLKIKRKGTSKRRRRLVGVLLVLLAVGWPVFVVTRLDRSTTADAPASQPSPGPAAPLAPGLERALGELEGAASEAGIAEALQPGIDQTRSAARSGDSALASQHLSGVSNRVDELSREGRLQGSALDDVRRGLEAVRAELGPASPPNPPAPPPNPPAPPPPG
ncbi:MAG: serine/threonine protein kinase [Actinomycetota bacterium]|nr:serine/threonine protein kinase [Actinomycetota bacterium]